VNWILDNSRLSPTVNLKFERVNSNCRIHTGVDKGGGPGGPAPPMAGQIFFVKIEGLLEPVVLNLSFIVRSNAMFTSERRY